MISTQTTLIARLLVRAPPTEVAVRCDQAGLPAAVPADHDDTFAALLGALPLAIGHGAGAQLRRPLGIAIVGGLIVSQALTLFTTLSFIFGSIGSSGSCGPDARARRHEEAALSRRSS